MSFPQTTSRLRSALTPALVLIPGAAACLTLIGAGSASVARAESPTASSAQGRACPGAHLGPAELSRQRAREAIVCLINRRRDNHGLGSLETNRRLQRAAQRHNALMLRTGCFAHECPREGTLRGRLRSVGYLADGLSRWICAENLAWGATHRGAPARIVHAWMHSPGHRATILTGELREIGVGFNRGIPSSRRASGAIFTTDFGLRVR